MSEKCICGHYFDNHARGPIEKIEHGRYWHKIVESRMNCKEYEFSKYGKKQSRWDKFWNPKESNNRLLP